MDSSPESSVSQPSGQQCKMKLALLLVGLALSAVVFLTLDWVRSAAIQRAAGKPKNCGVRDPVRHHAFKPNCGSIERWGGDVGVYEFFTNNLGLRDQSIREVPLADARPRILMLGNSFTQGMIAWRDSYVGRIAAGLPQYDFLNGGVVGYSVSNYLNLTRMLLAQGVDIDEVIVFAGVTEVQYEAAFYKDVDASGAVTVPERRHGTVPWYLTVRNKITMHLLLTNSILDSLARFLVRHGCYRFAPGLLGSDVFDLEGFAWTYRKVNEADPFPVGYGPLGVEGGEAKAKAKMTLLWQELQKRNIPISVVVYPYPAQLLHDTPDSRQVRLWRDWCEGKCKRFITVFPEFFAAKQQCPRLQPGCWYQKLFLFGDLHYNAAGDALVADAVIKSLEEDPPDKSNRPLRPGDSSQNSSVTKRNRFRRPR